MALALTLTVSACGGDSEPQIEGADDTTVESGGSTTTGVPVKADPTAILRYGTMQATSLDPVKQGTPCETGPLRLIYDTLTQWDKNNRIAPMLAESWTLDSPTQLTLKLRSGVVFQDGTPFNAEAVKFNLDRALHDPASTIQSLLYMVDNVEVVDDLTVRINMKTPAAGPLLSALADRAGMMISPTAYRAAGSQEAFNAAPVGSGMYKVEGEWRPVESLNVRSWDGYWDTETPRLGGIDMTDVKVDAMVNAINAGQMDLVVLDSTSQIPGVEGQEGTIVKVNAPPVPQVRIFLLNPNVPPLDDVRVRQAIAHALDRDTIADVMTDGRAEGASQWYPEGSMAYNPEIEDLYPYDPEKAKQLLAEAGYPNGFELTAVVGSSSTSYVQQGEIIQAMLEDVGIKMTLERIDTAQMVPTVYKGGPNDRGAAAAAPWGSSSTPDPDTIFRRVFLADGLTNNGGDEIPGVRELLDQAASTLDQDERSKLYQEVSKLQAEGLYEGVPLFHVPAIMAMKDYVGGIDKADVRCSATGSLRGVFITEGRVPATGPAE
ncbi:MAG TPA: ABC transporter substrate-binding protein [Acidimicrobiales bacterium]